MRLVLVSFIVLSCATASLAQSCVPAPYGILSWYRGEGNANDTIGGNNGAVNGTVTFGPGKVGQAFQFHGIQNDGVNLGDVPAFNFSATTSFSIEAWVKVAALSVAGGNDGMVIVSLNYRCTLAPATEMLAIQAPSWKAFFMVRDANNHQANVFSPPIQANQWIHLVGVRDATCNQLHLYMNGLLVDSVAFTTSTPLGNVGPDYIGRRFPCATNDPFNGSIDEVAVYNRALTPCEVAALYHAGPGGKCGPIGCGTLTSCGVPPTNRQ